MQARALQELLRQNAEELERYKQMVSSPVRAAGSRAGDGTDGVSTGTECTCTRDWPVVVMTESACVGRQAGRLHAVPLPL